MLEQTNISLTFTEKYDLFFKAAEKCDLNTIELLLHKYNVDVNAKTNIGWNALHKIANNNYNDTQYKSISTMENYRKIRY